MVEHQVPSTRRIGLAIAIAALVTASFFVATGPAFAAYGNGGHHGKVSACRLPALSGPKHVAQGSCRHNSRHGVGAVWNFWCRTHFRCAAHHLYLHPHFGLQGPVGRQLKPLPEGKYIKRFVRMGWVYHLSPRVMMAIGLIESYGGTTSRAYMGCLRPSTYGSWWKQITCAAQVLKRYGLAGYDPSNPSYPATIREHARGIIIRAR